jgi:Tol biopolymer transport system component/tRNA A-37 threonylcarbamoyl transferase component Bud32
MGVVYRARDTRLGREVALKFLSSDFADDPERHARFEREAKLLASLNHPHIAVLFGLEHLDGQHALAMELVEGEGLDERIARGPVPPEEALPVALQIAQALEAAHEKGIVHRDLKPANVRVRPDGVVKVLDFGLAKAWEATATDAEVALAPTMTGHHTQAGVILGTAAYMSPEQARGKPVDKRADIWAFGCVLYEMLTARRAFDADTMPDLIAAIVTREPDWSRLPAASPPRAREVMRRCLQKDVRSRLRDIGDARLLLDDLDAGGEAPVSPPAVPARGRERLAWVIAAIAVAGSALWALRTGRSRPPEELMRFAILPPAGRSIIGSVLLSPDSRRLLLPLADEAGRISVAVRSLDSLELRWLAGAEDVRGAFWSADGREVAFFSDRRLKRVAADGGPVQTVCESGSAFSGAWGSQGTILFSSYWGSPIMAVSATGGVPRPVTALDPVRGDLTHSHPAFLPDGKHFVFVAPNVDSAKTSIVLACTDSKEVRPLFHADSSAVFAQPGYLLFGRDDAVSAWRFDPGTLRLAGDPIPAFGQVHWLSADDFLGLSAAGSRVAYLSWSLRRRLVWVDRGGRELGTLGQVGGYTDVRISPDGRQVAVARRDPSRGRNLDIWVVDATRGTETRITADRNDEFNPAWFPDGERLVYVSDRFGFYDLYERPANGGAETILTRTKRDKLLPTVLPDGRRLLVDSPESGLHARVLVDLGADGEPTPLSGAARFSEQHPEISPDGRWTAFDSDESGQREVYVQPLSGGPKREVSVGGGQMPVWSRNGSELFYAARDGALKSIVLRLGAGSGEVGEPRSLFLLRPSVSGELPFHAHPYDVSPDGQRFLVIRSAPDAEPDGAVVVTNWTSVLDRAQ